MKHRLTRSRSERYVFWLLGLFFASLSFAAWIIPNTDVIRAEEFQGKWNSGEIRLGDEVKIFGELDFHQTGETVLNRLNVNDSGIDPEGLYQRFDRTRIYFEPPGDEGMNIGDRVILTGKVVRSEEGGDGIWDAFLLEVYEFNEIPGPHGNLLYGNIGIILYIGGCMALVYASINSAFSARDLVRAGGDTGYKVKSDDDVKSLSDQYSGMRMLQFVLFPLALLLSMGFAGPLAERFSPGYDVVALDKYVIIPFMFLGTIILISLCISLESPKILMRGELERYVKENEIFNRQVQEQLGRMKISTGTVAVGVTTCRACGYSLKDTWVACPQCGKELGSICPSCGEFLKSDWKKCPACQESLEVRPVDTDGLGQGRRYKRLRASQAEPDGGETRSPPGREDWDEMDEF